MFAPSRESVFAVPSVGGLASMEFFSALDELQGLARGGVPELSVDANDGCEAPVHTAGIGGPADGSGLVDARWGVTDIEKEDEPFGYCYRDMPSVDGPVEGSVDLGGCPTIAELIAAGRDVGAVGYRRVDDVYHCVPLATPGCLPVTALRVDDRVGASEFPRSAQRVEDVEPYLRLHCEQQGGTVDVVYMRRGEADPGTTPVHLETAGVVRFHHQVSFTAQGGAGLFVLSSRRQTVVNGVGIGGPGCGDVGVVVVFYGEVCVRTSGDMELAVLPLTSRLRRLLQQGGGLSRYSYQNRLAYKHGAVMIVARGAANVLGAAYTPRTGLSSGDWQMANDSGGLVQAVDVDKGDSSLLYAGQSVRMLTFERRMVCWPGYHDTVAVTAVGSDVFIDTMYHLPNYVTGVFTYSRGKLGGLGLSSGSHEQTYVMVSAIEDLYEFEDGGPEDAGGHCSGEELT